MKRQLLAFSVLLVTSVAAVPQSQINSAPPPAVSAGEFPIFPWDILPATRAAYEEARECGFNLAGFVRAENLDAVQATGLQCFVSDVAIDPRNGKVSDEEITAQAKAIAERTAKHPATFGYHVVDEPTAREMAATVKWAGALQAAAPDRVAFVNLLPMYGARDPAKVEETYAAYIDSYLTAVHPKAFSFDYYSMMDDGSIRANYFQCLEIVRRASIKNGVPFWNVCLANSHFRYAEPSAATFRFQVMSSLAYGARGLGWFTYTGRDRGNYHATAIDLAGRRTPTWDLLRDANEMARRLAAAYLPLKSVNVFHCPDVPVGCKGVAESQFVAEVKGKGPFVVGEFTDAAGRPALVIVNRDLQHSTTWEVTLKAKAPLVRVSPYTGKSRPVGAEDNWLPPGGGILLLTGQ